VLIVSLGITHYVFEAPKFTAWNEILNKSAAVSECSRFYAVKVN
jgi:hypothetical protein